jgi:hypothetical protein
VKRASVDVIDDSTILGTDDDEIVIAHPSIVARTITSCEHWCNE